MERLCRLIAVNLFNDKDQVLTIKYSDYDKFIILEVTEANSILAGLSYKHLNLLNFLKRRQDGMLVVFL